MIVGADCTVRAFPGSATVFKEPYRSFSFCIDSILLLGLASPLLLLLSVPSIATSSSTLRPMAFSKVSRNRAQVVILT